MSGPFVTLLLLSLLCGLVIPFLLVIKEVLAASHGTARSDSQQLVLDNLTRREDDNSFDIEMQRFLEQSHFHLTSDEGDEVGGAFMFFKDTFRGGDGSNTLLQSTRSSRVPSPVTIRRSSLSGGNLAELDRSDSRRLTESPETATSVISRFGFRTLSIASASTSASAASGSSTVTPSTPASPVTPTSAAATATAAASNRASCYTGATSSRELSQSPSSSSMTRTTPPSTRMSFPPDVQDEIFRDMELTRRRYSSSFDDATSSTESSAHIDGGAIASGRRRLSSSSTASLHNEGIGTMSTYESSHNFHSLSVDRGERDSSKFESKESERDWEGRQGREGGSWFEGAFKAQRRASVDSTAAPLGMHGEPRRRYSYSLGLDIEVDGGVYQETAQQPQQLTSPKPRRGSFFSTESPASHLGMSGHGAGVSGHGAGVSGHGAGRDGPRMQRRASSSADLSGPHIAAATLSALAGKRNTASTSMAMKI